MALDFVDLRVNQVSVVEDPLGGGGERVIEPRGLHQVVPGSLQRDFVFPQAVEYRAPGQRGPGVPAPLNSGLTAKFGRTTNIAGDPAELQNIDDAFDLPWLRLRHQHRFAFQTERRVAAGRTRGILPESRTTQTRATC